jgi:hypothetical protein
MCSPVHTDSKPASSIARANAGTLEPNIPMLVASPIFTSASRNYPIFVIRMRAAFDRA